MICSIFTGAIENVKLHVDLSIAYLEDFILSRSYKPWNAFFSGSGKSKEVMFFWKKQKAKTQKT
jgi:hypothetical protein